MFYITFILCVFLSQYVFFHKNFCAAIKSEFIIFLNEILFCRVLCYAKYYTKECAMLKLVMRWYLSSLETMQEKKFT